MNGRLPKLEGEWVRIETVHGNWYDGPVLRQTTGCLRISQGERHFISIPLSRVKEITVK